jgi:hypothetical protein
MLREVLFIGLKTTKKAGNRVAPRIVVRVFGIIQFLNRSSMGYSIGLFSAKMAIRSSRMSYW